MIHLYVDIVCIVHQRNMINIGAQQENACVHTYINIDAQKKVEKEGMEGLRGRTMYSVIDIKLGVRDKGSDTHQRPASKCVQCKAAKMHEKSMAQRGSCIEQCIWRLTSNCASEVRDTHQRSASKCVQCKALHCTHLQWSKIAMEYGKEGLRRRTMCLEVDIKLYVRDKGSDTHQRPASKYVQCKATELQWSMARKGSEVEQCIWRLTSSCTSEIRQVIHISAQQANTCSAKP